MIVQRRLATFLLALAGAVCVHWVVYSLALPVFDGGARTTNGHGYLPVVSSLVLPAGLVSLCWFSVRSARDAFVGHELSTVTLAGAIGGLFIGQEVVEQVLAVGSVAFDVALVLGALLALPAAALFRRLVATVAEIVRDFIAAAKPRFGATPATWFARDVDVTVRRVECSPLIGRAPPALS